MVKWRRLEAECCSVVVVLGESSHEWMLLVYGLERGEGVAEMPGAGLRAVAG